MQCSKHGRQLPLCHGLLSSIAPFMHCNGIIPPGATRKIHSKLRKACVIVLMVVLHQSRAPFPLLRISHTVRGPPLQHTKLVHTQPSTRTNKNYVVLYPALHTAAMCYHKWYKFGRATWCLIKKNLSRECSQSHVLTHPKIEFLVHVRHSTLAFIRPADQNNLAILECLSLSTHLYIFVSVVFLRDLQPKQVWHAGIWWQSSVPQFTFTFKRVIASTEANCHGYGNTEAKLRIWQLCACKDLQYSI